MTVNAGLNELEGAVGLLDSPSSLMAAFMSPAR